MRKIKRNDTTYMGSGITLHFYGEDEGVVAKCTESTLAGETRTIVEIGPAFDYGGWIGPDSLITVTRQKRYGEWRVEISWSSWGSREDPDAVSRVVDSFAIAQTWFASLNAR